MSRTRTAGRSRPVTALTVAAGVTATARRALGSFGQDERWTRTNHRGESISLLEGPAVAAGLIAGTVVGGDHSRQRVATTLATAGGAFFGLVDDLGEDTAVRTKGLRGHLGALAQGQVTTGGLKVLGIGGAALLAAMVGTKRTGGWGAHGFDVTTNALLIAGTANLVNLLDLRPGRALKASVVAGLTPGPAGAAGAIVGAAAAAARADLGEQDMLGDCGANALGALIGTRWALGLPRGVRVGALAGVVGLTLASEKVSFSAVIEATPWLHRIDSWGRRPAEPVDGVETDTCA